MVGYLMTKRPAGPNLAVRRHRLITGITSVTVATLDSNSHTLSHVVSFLFVINNHAFFSSCSICLVFLLISQFFHYLLFLTRPAHQRLLFSQLQSPLGPSNSLHLHPIPPSDFKTTRDLNISIPFRPELVSVLPICCPCHDASVKGSILLAACVSAPPA